MPDGAFEVCIPAATGERVYFTTIFRNKGDRDVTIDRVTAEGENLGGEEHLVDGLQGQTGTRLGYGAWPTDEPLGGEARVFARSLPAEGYVVASGDEASLISFFEPSQATLDTVVSQIQVEYLVRGRASVEKVHHRYRIAAGDC